MESLWYKSYMALSLCKLAKAIISHIFLHSCHLHLILINAIGYLKVAIIDGIVMGGGAGLSLQGTFRIVTENTVCFCFTYCFILFLWQHRKLISLSDISERAKSSIGWGTFIYATWFLHFASEGLSSFHELMFLQFEES
jgi:hypothetical protein